MFLRSTLGRIGLALLSGALCLAIAEGVLRSLPDSDDFPNRIRRFAATMLVDDPDLSHRLRPSQELTIGGVVYRTNRLGLRGPEPILDGPVPRILVLGDSVTMGWGVAFEAAYPAQLESVLEQSGHPAEVVNAGILAYGIHQYQPWLEELRTHVQPDLVLVGYYPNDPEPIERSILHPSGSSSRVLRRGRALVRTLLLRIGILPNAAEY